MYTDLGILTEAAFIKHLQQNNGDLSNFSYVVSQNVFLSNYELTGKYSWSSPLPYDIKLGEGKFERICIYGLNCSSLDFQQSTFRFSPEIDENTLKVKTLNLRGVKTSKCSR